MLLLTDDRNRELKFSGPPQRVVSLVPSDTFSVAELLAGSSLVGRTDYCELPADVRERVPSVGGTKNPRLDEICALSPDLILANQEENTKSDLEALAQAGLRVYVAFPKRMSEGLAHLAKLARIFHVASDARVKELLRTGYEELREATSRTGTRRRAFCPIWMKPLMTIHGDTFISDVLVRAGFENVFAKRERLYPLAADLGRAAAKAGADVAGRDTRYPRVTVDEVARAQPELVLLPTEPHPFSEEDAAVFRALDIPAARTNDIRFVDGKDLCWYGARSIGALERLRVATQSA